MNVMLLAAAGYLLVLSLTSVLVLPLLRARSRDEASDKRAGAGLPATGRQVRPPAPRTAVRSPRRPAVRSTR